jgi:hypothetical protein
VVGQVKPPGCQHSQPGAEIADDHGGAPVPTVSKHPGDGGEQHVGRLLGHLHQRQQHHRFGLVVDPHAQCEAGEL